jgi:hypothetical protein
MVIATQFKEAAESAVLHVPAGNQGVFSTLAAAMASG